MEFDFLDVSNSLDDVIESQEKLLKSFETMVSVTDDRSNQTRRSMVYSEDKMKLFHYDKIAKTVNKVPVLIVYALVNTPYMMDIGPDKSFIKNLLNEGMDIYLIDWGFPTKDDRYITLDDYVNGYIDNAVNYILEENKLDKINILGVCQGGTFSIMYSALHPEKVKNLITMVTPVDFSTNDGLLFRWGKYLNVDNMARAYGVIPGELMNSGFLTLKPISLTVSKYLDLINDLDDPDSMSNFITMESWIFNSPGQVGEAYRQFINWMYKENRLIKGELELGGKKVDMKNIKMPVLNLYAERDNQVPNAASIPLEKHVGSKDATTKSFPTGHIGMFVSGRSQREIAPFIAKWVKEHSK